MGNGRSSLPIMLVRALLGIVVMAAERGLAAPGAPPAPTPAAPVAPAPNAGHLDPEDRTVYGFGIMGSRHNLKAGDGYELLGNSGALQISMGRIAANWYALGSVDILLGPDEPARSQTIDLDYSGTGATLWLGFSAQTLNLRSAEGGYGFALGLSYSDIVGRMVGRRAADEDRVVFSPTTRGDTEVRRGVRVEDYVVRLTSLALLPAVFFCWLDPERPRGNAPELLATRLEGYILTIGAAMPLVVDYQARYNMRERRDVTVGRIGEDEGTDPAPPSHDEPRSGLDERVGSRVEHYRQAGQVHGYSLLVTLTALFGA